MKRLCKYRNKVTIEGTSCSYAVQGPWHYRYLDEDYINSRNGYVVSEVLDFDRALKLSEDLWCGVCSEKNFFTRKPYIGILDRDGWYVQGKVYKKTFIKATHFFEYEMVNPDSHTFLTLANHLPPRDFIDFVKDCYLEVSE